MNLWNSKSQLVDKPKYTRDSKVSSTPKKGPVFANKIENHQ